MGRSGRATIPCDGAASTKLEDDYIHGEPSTQIPMTVTSKMGVDQISDILRSRGVLDLTSLLDPSLTNSYPISRGGSADIYHTRLQHGSDVAVKCLRLSLGYSNPGNKALKHIAHELYVWSKCNHPNVLELMGMALFRGQISLISPWMENGSLPLFLERHPNAPRYELCAQIAGAVAYLHDIGIVHGDIKGLNVLVSKDHTIKLGGFGNAQISRNSVQFSESSDTRGMSFRWAAPELIMEESQGPTIYTDVYSLGMTILEIISGTVPYNDLGSDMRVLASIIRRVLPRRPEQLSNDQIGGDILWSLLLRCWSVDPPDRPPASDVWEEIEVLSTTAKDGSCNQSVSLSSIVFPPAPTTSMQK
ncbi:hypothetical protein OPQ81_010635 [Rhizoctonia solani]|nr:hypothetical protein OPQ81_010635 [Rhizoctonia solani]